MRLFIDSRLELLDGKTCTGSASGRGTCSSDRMGDGARPVGCEVELNDDVAPDESGKEENVERQGF